MSVADMVLFDARALADPRHSGVHVVTRALIRGLAATAPRGEVVAVANAAGAGASRVRAALGPEVPCVIRRFPNKLIHAGMRLAGRPRLEDLAGVAGRTTVVANPQFLSVRPDSTLVLIVHDLSYFREPAFFSRRARRWHRAVHFPRLVARADRLVAFSAHTRRDLMELFGISAAKIVLLRPGIDPAFFSPPAAAARDALRSRLALPREYALLFADGPRKNLSVALAGLAAARLPGLALAVIGPEDPRAVRRAAARAGIAGRVHPLGYRSDEERRILLSGARVLLYPSLYEGFGLPPVEAMALGVPVIAGHGAALGETLGEGAVLVDPQDAAALACALEQVLGDPAATAARTARGRVFAAEHCWETAVADLRRIIAAARHAPLRSATGAAVVHYRHAHRH